MYIYILVIQSKQTGQSLVWFGLFLWHINLCRFSDVKSNFIHSTVLFKTIQFSIITQFKGQHSSISNTSVQHKYRF